MLGTLMAAAGPAAGAVGEAVGGGGSSDQLSTGPVYSGGSQGAISVNTGGGAGVNLWAIGGIGMAIIGGVYVASRSKG